MTAPTYLTVCPGCGGPLQPVALGPEHAPWICPTNCRRGFFVVELSGEARKSFRPGSLDYGFGPWPVRLHQLIDNERAEARKRGTSLREDQLALIPLAVLDALWPLTGPFGALVAAAKTSRRAAAPAAGATGAA